MGIATGVLTITTIPAMLIIDMVRKGAFTSMVLVELIWLGILWVLWLAQAGLSASADVIFAVGCPYSETLDPVNAEACKEFAVIEAFSFLNWLALFGYWIAILVLSLMGAQRGNAVFKSSVAEAPFLQPRATAPAYNPDAKVSMQQQQQPQYAMQQQQPVQQQYAAQPQFQAGYPAHPAQGTPVMPQYTAGSQGYPQV